MFPKNVSDVLCCKPTHYNLKSMTVTISSKMVLKIDELHHFMVLILQWFTMKDYWSTQDQCHTPFLDRYRHRITLSIFYAYYTSQTVNINQRDQNLIRTDSGKTEVFSLQ
jgi:hypothetical protein